MTLFDDTPPDQVIKIAIVRLSALGDILHTIPAVWRLKQAVPEAEISWFVEKSNARLLECFIPFVKIETVSLKGKPLGHLLTEIRRIRSRFRNYFHMVLDFQGLIKSALLSVFLSSHRVGFHQKNLKEGVAGRFYTDSAAPLDETQHIIRKNISLADYLLAEQFQIVPSQMDVQYPDQIQYDGTANQQFLDRHHLKDREFIILNIGGGWITKILSFQQNLEIINALKKNGFTPVLLWGNNREKQSAKAISEASGTLMFDFLSFSELFDMISRSRFIITADTLALHIADVVGTKSIGIFGPTVPGRNGSLNPGSTSVYREFDCSACHRKQCRTMKCISWIGSKSIMAAVESIEASSGSDEGT